MDRNTFPFAACCNNTTRNIRMHEAASRVSNEQVNNRGGIRAPRIRHEVIGLHRKRPSPTFDPGAMHAHLMTLTCQAANWTLEPCAVPGLHRTLAFAMRTAAVSRAATIPPLCARRLSISVRFQLSSPRLNAIYRRPPDAALHPCLPYSRGITRKRMVRAAGCLSPACPWARFLLRRLPFDYPVAS